MPVSGDESIDHRRSSYGREYWLRRCEGFLAETRTKRIGRVDGIRYGKFSRRVFLISVNEVEQVLPEERRIVVKDPPQLSPG